MNKTLLQGLCFATLLLTITSDDSIANPPSDKFRPPAMEEVVTNRIYVLFKKTHDRNLAVDAVNAIRQGRPTDLPAQALRSSPPFAGRTMLSQKPRSYGLSEARERLSRYAVLDFPLTAEIRGIASALAGDPNIEYVAIDTLLAVNESACTVDTDGDGEWMDEDYLSEYSQSHYSKTWGREALFIDQAWAYARGHTYIIAADAGIDPTHNDLVDFPGFQYSGGNFHAHLAVDSGGCPDDGLLGDAEAVNNSNCSRISESGTSPVTFTGEAFFGFIDEYKVRRSAGDQLDCGDGDVWHLASYAGHGTHVAGLLSADPDSKGTKGACKHCPTTMARANWVQRCNIGIQRNTATSTSSGTPHEADLRPSLYSSAAAIAFALEIGAQVINFSGGSSNMVESFCVTVAVNDPWCSVLEYAEERDVMIFASAGNRGIDENVDFPADVPGVYGVGGISPNGNRWLEPNCGSNAHPDPLVGISFAGPAEGVYSTMYSHMNYVPSSCHEHNDDIEDDGYGYCSGTSMAAPFLAGIAGLVRSVNPLSRKDGVFESMKRTTDRELAGLGWAPATGWGIPRAQHAVKDMLGTVNGTQVRNRVTPLFVLFGTHAQDFVYTTKPQVALAFNINDEWGYGMWGGAMSVGGFTFAEAAEYGSPTPKANTFVFTTHVSPDPNVPLTPIYRMRKTKLHNGNIDNADSLLVTSTSEINTFSWSSYKLEGMEGYIFAPCTPEPSCIPVGAQKLYRAYNSSKDDHAVFLEFKKSYFDSSAYTNDLVVLGYAYRNVDSDSDNLIDGLELTIGTDRYNSDSDLDQCTDSEEFPLIDRPQSDPISAASTVCP